MDTLQFVKLKIQPKMKILMGHGLGQSGAIFKHKTRALEQALEASLRQSPKYFRHELEFFYPDGPQKCLSPDLTELTTATPEFSDSFCWTRETDNTSDFDPTVFLKKIASCIKLYGPFDGAICFSQGGLAVALAATLLVKEHISSGELAQYSSLFYDPVTNQRIQPPFKFLATFCAPDIIHSKFYPLWSPKVSTPMLQVIGKYDSLVDERSSRGLAAKFSRSQVLVHRGAHFLPRDKACIDHVINFIAKALGEQKTIIVSYFDKDANAKIEKENDDSSEGSSGSSVTTPITPTTPGSAEFGPSKTQKELWRRSSGWQPSVVRISRSKRGSVGYF